MLKIRDEVGKIYNEIHKPAVVYDRVSNVLLKIGEQSDMLDYFNFIQETYRSNGFGIYADDIVYFEVPKDQDLIDKIFNISGYVGKFYKDNFLFN